MSDVKRTQQPTSRGFTVVELLVIAPVVILTIGAFISVIVGMTGEVLATRASGALAYNLQDTLNRIEDDVKLSTTFLAETNVDITSPQGFNNDTTVFENVDNTNGDMLILNTLATTANPLLEANSLVYLANQPNACNSTEVTQNKPLTMNIVYFVKNDTATNVSSLWRRTIAPPNYTTIGCATPWQQPSCTPGQAGSYCVTQDVRLLDDVQPEDFVVQYFNTADASIENAIASDTGALPATRNAALQATTSVGVSLNVTSTAAGRQIEQSGSVRATKLDTNASVIADEVDAIVPVAPSLSATTAAPASVVFTWPSSPGATGYTFQYQINGTGGAWTTAFTNQNNLTYSVSANHTDVVYGRVSATSSAGTSAYSAVASSTIPLWATPLLYNNWSNYDGGFATAAYTKTSSGVVMLKGSIKRTGAVVLGEVIANLPEGYRPQYELNFIVAITGGNTGSIEIQPNGNVVAWTDANATITNLDRIAFLPSGAPYSWTNFSPISNGWSNRGATDDPPFSYAIDSTGRFHMRGALTPGTITDGTTIVTLPVAGQMNPKYIMAVRSGGGGLNAVNVGTSSGTTLSPRGIAAGTAVFPNLSYHPNAYAGWNALPFLNGWTNFDVNNTTAAYTKSSDNVVSVKGLVRSGSSATANIGTLPVGFRPKERLNFASVCNQAACRVNITPDGNINLTQGSTTWSSLSGINFIADQ